MQTDIIFIWKKTVGLTFFIAVCLLCMKMVLIRDDNQELVLVENRFPVDRFIGIDVTGTQPCFV